MSRTPKTTPMIASALTPIAEQLAPPGGWQTPGRVRLPPLSLAEARLPTRLFVGLVNRIGRLDAANLFLMLAHNLRLLRAWLGFAARLMPYGELDRRDSERVILRVGWNCRARYEWGQHVDIAQRAGVPAADIARIALGPEAPGWDARSALLLRACDEFHHLRMVSEPTWQGLSAHFEPRLMIELLLLIGHYEMLAGVLNSTGLPLDTRLEQVLAAAPIHYRGRA